MKKSPTIMLYKWPGKRDIHGDKFDYIKIEKTPEKIKLAIEDGWRLTTAEAKALKSIGNQETKENALNNSLENIEVENIQVEDIEVESLNNDLVVESGIKKRGRKPKNK